MAVPEITPISLGFVNCFIVKGADALMLVDTGTPGNERKILDRVAALGFRPDQVALILITHAHADHTGSLHALQQATGARVAIHKADAPYLAAGQSAEVVARSWVGRVMKVMTRFAPQTQGGVTPDIVIDDEWDLCAFGVAGRVLSTPGHTAGSVTVLLDSGACLVGDLLAAWRKPGYPPFVQDQAALRDSIRKVIRSGATEVYPSHGAAFSIDAIRGLVE
jgi:hydroxyacylglutathione hydrolase